MREKNTPVELFCRLSRVIKRVEEAIAHIPKRHPANCGMWARTNENELCQRRYLPGGPYGTNPNRSEFFSNVLFLDHLRWDIIEDRWFNDDEKTRIKHAEVLIPDSLPLDLIQAISVNSKDMAKAVNQLITIASYRTKLRVPFATYKPELFFQ